MTDFRSIAEIPEDRKDGRPVLIQTYFGTRRTRRARWWKGGAWVDIATGGKLLGVEGWADDQGSGAI